MKAWQIDSPEPDSSSSLSSSENEENLEHPIFKDTLDSPTRGTWPSFAGTFRIRPTGSAVVDLTSKPLIMSKRKIPVKRVRGESEMSPSPPVKEPEATSPRPSKRSKRMACEVCLNARPKSWCDIPQAYGYSYLCSQCLNAILLSSLSTMEKEESEKQEPSTISMTSSLSISTATPPSGSMDTSTSQ